MTRPDSVPWPNGSRVAVATNPTAREHYEFAKDTIAIDKDGHELSADELAALDRMIDTHETLSCNGRCIHPVSFAGGITRFEVLGETMNHQAAAMGSECSKR